MLHKTYFLRYRKKAENEGFAIMIIIIDRVKKKNMVGIGEKAFPHWIS